MRLYIRADTKDAAALPELQAWCRRKFANVLEAPPRPIGGPSPDGMNAGVAALEIVAATAEIFNVIVALARRHKVDHHPTTTVSAQWPDGPTFRVESDDPAAVAAIVQALGGS